MFDYTNKPFELKRINCPLPSFYKLVLRYDGHAQDHISFQHGEITEQNAKLMHYEMWAEFKQFCHKCMKKIPNHKRFQKIKYGSSYGFPVCVMPDNSHVITINYLDDRYTLHFAWVVESGGCDE